MKKKILFTIDSLGCGGAERSLLSLLNLLDYERYDVDLLLYKHGGTFEKYVPKQVRILPEIPFAKLSRLPIWKLFLHGQWKAAIARARFSLALRRNHRGIHSAQVFWKCCGNAIQPLPEKYDAAIGYNQGFSTYFTCEKVTAKKKLTWVNTNYKEAGYAAGLDYAHYRKADCIVAVSDVAKAVLIEQFPEFTKKITVVYDITSPKYVNALAQEFCMESVDADKLRIVTVGRLVSPKGYDIALNAAKILKETDLDFVWRIIGEGGERAKMEQYIHENGLESYIRLLGQLDNPYPYITNSDIYVQTSRFEGFGLAIAEARMLNVPVVTTQFNCVFDQMKQGENGLVVDMTPEAVADGIRRLLEDRQLYEHIKAYLSTEKKGNEEEIEKFYKLIEA